MIKSHDIKGYHKVIEGTDDESGLHCFIAIHDISLGPALGGARFFPYANKEDALVDALRLAKGMTYKSAIAEDGLGGGKSVIIGNPAKLKTEKLLLRFGEVINSLGGTYIAAEDVGTNTEDMLVIRKQTPYVAAMPVETSSGDPSRFTAWGVFRGMQAVAKILWGTTSLRKKRIAIQGLGSVGSKLANILFWEGAELIVTDINPAILHEVEVLYGAKVVSPKEIAGVECDIFAPCAMGGSINDETISKLRCKAIAGSANNQLLDTRHGVELMKRDILYAPDYVINAGGIINSSLEFVPGGYNPKVSRDKVNHIYDTLLEIFEEAKRLDKPTSLYADELAEYKLKHLVGKRATPLIFSK